MGTLHGKQHTGLHTYLPPLAKFEMFSFTFSSTSNGVPVSNSLDTSIFAPKMVTFGNSSLKDGDGRSTDAEREVGRFLRGEAAEQRRDELNDVA